MRGFVMVLMALDHASEMWNAGRFNADSVYLLDPETGVPVWLAGTVIPAADFFTRWVTHLCAPTFLFLTGTSLALSIENRARRGESAGSLDRHLLIRALVILGLEGLLTLLISEAFMGSLPACQPVSIPGTRTSRTHLAGLFQDGNIGQGGEGRGQ